MILVRDDLDFKLNLVCSNDNGQYIIMEAEVQGSSVLFVNICAPNSMQDQCCFYDNLNKNIEENIMENENRITLEAILMSHFIQAGTALAGISQRKLQLNALKIYAWILI